MLALGYRRRLGNPFAAVVLGSLSFVSWACLGRPYVRWAVPRRSGDSQCWRWALHIALGADVYGVAGVVVGFPNLGARFFV